MSNKTAEQIIEDAYKEGRRRGRNLQAGEINEVEEILQSEEYCKKKAQELPGPVQPSMEGMKEKAERAKEIFDKTPILDDASEPFKEGVFQGIQLGLMEPVSSPSDLIVEVDGERKGKCLSADDEEVFVIGVSCHIDYSMHAHHIRLLTPSGGVVVDNKLNLKNDE